MSIRLSSKQRKDAFAALAIRDGKHCRICGIGHRVIWRRAGIFSTPAPDRHRYTRVNPSSNLEIEHIIPLARGGTHALDNLQLLCTACHKIKTDAERRRNGARG